jgi:hypothetical protein
MANYPNLRARLLVARREMLAVLAATDVRTAAKHMAMMRAVEKAFRDIDQVLLANEAKAHRERSRAETLFAPDPK